jgi:hypothetical protein
VPFRACLEKRFSHFYFDFVDRLLNNPKHHAFSGDFVEIVQLGDKLTSKSLLIAPLCIRERFLQTLLLPRRSLRLLFVRVLQIH